MDNNTYFKCDEKSCFACKGGLCAILVKPFEGYCPFYKSQQQYADAQKKTEKRIEKVYSLGYNDFLALKYKNTYGKRGGRGS